MRELYVAIRFDDGELHEVGTTVELPDGSPDELAAIDRLIGAGILSPMPVTPSVPMPAPDLQDGSQPLLREPHPLGDLTNVSPAPPTLPQTAPASVPLSTPATTGQVTQTPPQDLQHEPQPRDAQGNLIPVPDADSPVEKTPRKTSARKSIKPRKKTDPGRGS